jgi:mRNA interferase MazF
VSLSLKRGVVVSVRFHPAQGREIRKTRPAIIVSNDIACRLDAVVQVVPLTRLPKRPLRPYESQVTSEASEINRNSRAVANQVRTVSKKRIGELIGELTPEEQDKLDRALRIQLALID